MQGLRRYVLMAAMVAAGALALAALAAARGVPVEATVSAEKGGPPIDQASVTDKAKTFWVKAKNATDQHLDVTLEDRSKADPPGDFKVRWFRGEHEITAAANAGDYEFQLKPGDRKTFRAKVKPRVDAPGELCLFGAFMPAGDQESYALVYINSGSICG